MNKGIAFVIWFVLFMGVISGSFSLISEPSTIANVIGLIALIIIVAISVKTRCLTNLVGNKDDRGESEEGAAASGVDK